MPTLSQILSVSRAFYKDSEILILDEPTAALDPIAEYKMYENLIKVTENKTVLYISHRLSSAVLSDRIIVIGDGRVLEQGSHDELMALGGKYAYMFNLQAEKYKDV